MKFAADAHLTDLHHRRSAIALTAQALGASALLALHLDSALTWSLAGWLLVFGGVWAWRLALSWRYRRRAPVPDADWRPWQRASERATLATGLVWSLALALFYGPGDPLQRVALVMLAYGYCVALPPMRQRVFLAYAAMTFAPVMAWTGVEGREHSVAMAGVTALGLVATVLIWRQQTRRFLELLALKRQTETMAGQLQSEKLAADAARFKAEQATQAKTQFFQAASHDLRQPLHALGLFVAALRQRRLDPASARLVDNIAESVAALDGLFAEMLDLTRIDSGGVTPQRQALAMASVYDRLRLDFEAMAFEKRLSLRFVGAAHRVLVDDVLLERILRNLLGNAIRYTERGGVMLSCRPRAGGFVIQVWDTGIGIRAEALPRIFDEFYQADGRRPLLPHHRQGLGLGLAIVRRLADALHWPLGVRSVPDRGTVFSLEVPAAGRLGADPSAGTDLALQHAVSSLAPVARLSGRYIVIVDDDPAALDGLQRLLEGWGASVLGLASGAAAADWASRDGAAVPDLVIVDQHLSDGWQGTRLVALMRQRLGGTLPAVILTADRRPELAQEVAALGAHHLDKPLVPTRLQALVDFNLALTSASRSGAAAYNASPN
jgi:two-component system, sensor histidine kinase